MRLSNPQATKEATSQKHIAAGELQQLLPSFFVAL
jgi:hypothetical protein